MLGLKKNFSDLHPICYKISEGKEILKRHLCDLFSRQRIAKAKSNDILPILVSSFQTNMIKRSPGVELITQLNKADNIRIASSKINKLLVRPGETFSFWQTVGKITRRRGYKDGRIITDKGLVTGIGGGLCNLANSLNRIVLQSPMTVTEFHKHSDALAPDTGKRIPLSAGTSVSYNYIDYRFKNETDQSFQLLTWCEGDEFFCELHSEKPLSYRYELIEKDRYFRKENGIYYHFSKLYLITTDGDGNTIKTELIWDNRSKVMYDYSLIPPELICD
ncbi:MAG: VanW family protein [Clostridia bacterium]|nr:VanW family protein [Clostridia bacterium]